MKILVTGINGQVGHALMRELTDYELIGLTRQDCDLTNKDQIRQVIDQHQPDPRAGHGHHGSTAPSRSSVLYRRIIERCCVILCRVL